MLRIALMSLLAAAFGMDAEAAVRVYRPTHPSEVVLRLGSSSTEMDLMRLRTAVRNDPGDADALMRYVDALIEAGARTGNERYYGFAEQALATTGKVSHVGLDLKRAQLLQHRHEFRDAEHVLSEILRHNWRNREARLMRAQVRLHLRLPQSALQDCAALTALADVLTSATCIAQAQAASGEVKRAYQLVTTTLDSQQGDAVTRSWSAGVAAELAARLGDANAAGRRYKEAFDLDPTSHYARLTYADWLLAHARYPAALEVASTGSSLADRARYILARRDANSHEARRLQLAWEEASARGERGHLRDQARFELLLRRNPAKAHGLAAESFREHGEPDDALILAQTAIETQDREALRAIDAWRRQHRYHDVRLDRLMEAVR